MTHPLPHSFARFTHALLCALVALLFTLAGCASDASDSSESSGGNGGGNGNNGNPPPDDDDAPKAAKSEFTMSIDGQKDGFAYKHLVFRHPAFHGKSTDVSVTQHVDVVIPMGTPMDAPLYVWVDGENASSLDRLLEATALPRFLHGKYIYVGLEHRGYGQSLSDDEDQTVPLYVTPEQAIEDTHAVIKALSKTYTGPRVIAGYSYAGSVVVEHGKRYPEDAVAFVSSSGPVHLPSFAVYYEGFIRSALGDEAFTNASKLMEGLKPGKAFDTIWADREMLETLWSGSAQSASAQDFLNFFRSLAARPGEEAATEFRKLQKDNGDETGSAWGDGRAMTKVTRKDALERDLGWHTYFFQQCAQTGGFWISPTGDGVFRRTIEERQAECEQMFGKEHVLDLLEGDPKWQPADALESYEDAGSKLIYVRGGKDPWGETFIETPNWAPRVHNAKYNVYDTKFGSFLNVPQGFHCPDRDDSEVAMALWAEISRTVEEAVKAAGSTDR